MDKKEEELLSMHYQMEKTDIKQQRLEDRLMSISEDLRKSKNIRNLYFFFIIVLILLIAIGGFYWTQDNGVDQYSDDTKKIEHLQLLNDSLQKEVSKLKSSFLMGKNEMTGVEDSTSLSKDSIAGKLKLDKRYCYIKRAFKSNDVIFVEVDFIEYYYGKRAVKKAKEFGDAEYDLDKNGDTLYFLYKNYYINNQNPSTRILEIDDRAQVRVESINQISKGFPLKAFQKIITNKPVLILETNNGVVYKITQQKLP
ncbi:hypothetical protein [Aquimarina mytili]|uniref:Uncharacterized protein n=1 Tax=Aquimarina mytili TaxID=874423 RepID=A0A936ZVQ8_9FLAO|nr:hypothetical protein [Aquimarina mytili]MBL0683091.1 hypothetical protein [Aquimarina mytili]